MVFKENKKKILGIEPEKNNRIKKLSLGLHTMPKTETGHFQKWLVLALLIFVFIVLLVLFFIQ